MAIKLEGEGGKAIMAWPLVEDFFCGFPWGLSGMPGLSKELIFQALI